MKIENQVIKWGAFALVVVFVFGVALPFLFSAASNALVVAGFVLLIVAIFGIVKFIRKQITNKQ